MVDAELGSDGAGSVLLLFLEVVSSARWTVERTNSGESILSRCVRKRDRQGAGLLWLGVLAMLDGDDDGGAGGCRVEVETGLMWPRC